MLTVRDWQNGAALLFWAAFAIWYWRSGRRGRSEADPRSTSPPTGNWRRDLLCAAAATIPFWFFSNIGLLSDDFVHASRPFVWSDALRTFAEPGGDGMYRPIGNVLLSLEASLWRDSPVGWHAVSILLHGANVFLLCRIGSRYGLPSAPFAALLFAVAGARCEPVLWPAAQYDLWMTLFLLSGVLAMLQGQDWLALAMIPLAALTKEPGFLLVPVLVLLKRRIWWPHAVTLLALVVWRLYLFGGGIGGYAANETSPFRFAKAIETLLWRVPGVLVSGWNLIAPKSPLETILMALTPIATAAAFALCRSRRTNGVWPFAVSALLSLAVVIRLSPVEPSLEKSRMLYLPASFLALLLAGLRFEKRAAWALLIGAAAVALVSNARVESQVAQQANELCRQKPDTDPKSLPRTVNGVYFFANGFPECVKLSR